MLIEGLYTVDAFTDEAGKITAAVTVNAAHPVFAGHFPGQPVLPGVCQLQMVKELLEKAVGQKLILKEAGNCKFLQMIDPVQTRMMTIIIDYRFRDSNLLCNAVIKTGETVFLKMDGLYAPQ